MKTQDEIKALETTIAAILGDITPNITSVKYNPSFKSVVVKFDIGSGIDSQIFIRLRFDELDLSVSEVPTIVGDSRSISQYTTILSILNMCVADKNKIVSAVKSLNFD